MTAYEQRSYPGAAADTVLTADLAIGGTAFSVTAGTGSGYPDGSTGPFFVIIDWDNSKAEKVRCSGRVNDTFTVAGSGGGRGQDGTTAVAHTAPAKVRAVWTATDAQETNRAAANTIGKVTTKGDLLTGSGANTLARTAAGADGTVVQFDSTQPGGVRASTNTLPAGPLVGTTDAQTLTNKTLTAPTVNGATFTGAINGAATVDTNGHYVGGGSAPTAAAGVGNGASPPAPQVAAGATDQSGQIAFGTGVGPGTTPQVTVTFNRAYSATPKVVISPDTAAAAAIALWVDAVTTTGFHVSSNTAPASSQTVGTYGFSYVVVG